MALPLADDMSGFLSVDEFAETITYTPGAIAEDAVEIAAQVFRRRANPEAGEHGGRSIPTRRLEIIIANHATIGRDSITERLDTVAAKLKLSDGSATTFLVTKILKQDAGAWHLEVIA